MKSLVDTTYKKPVNLLEIRIEHRKAVTHGVIFKSSIAEEKLDTVIYGIRFIWQTSI